MIGAANMTRMFCTVALVWSITSAAAPTAWDGPYVGHDPANQWTALWVESESGSLDVRRQKVSLGDEIDVPGVGTRPSFKVRLRDSTELAPDIVELPSSSDLFVVADTHGEYEIATELLIRHRIIDEKLAWSFGKGHVVFLGDVFDRGQHQTELLWLIYKLEAEAHQAGGRVDLILGNHESMVLLGDERYLHPKYLRSPRLLNAPGYKTLWGTNTLLGRWLRTKAAVMKIGDYLCLHGGLSPEIVERKLTLQTLNTTVRDGLKARHALPQAEAHNLTFIMGPNGPLWYRGYFADMRQQGGPAQATSEDIQKLLAHFDARAILVGHTRVPTITALYGDKVVAVQVYPHREEASGEAIMEALLIKSGKFFRAKANGSLEALDGKAE